MGIQEQAFRAYYASMSDADLLSTTKNKNSFIRKCFGMAFWPPNSMKKLA